MNRVSPRRRRSSESRKSSSPRRQRRRSSGKKGRRSSRSRRRRRRSSEKTESLQLADKSVMVRMQDSQLEEMLTLENEDFFSELFGLNKKADEIAKRTSKCNEGVADLARALSQNQTGLIVERLKKQIADSFVDFQKRTKMKQQEINGLSLENSYQVEVSLLAKMNNESAHVRDEILQSCFDCNRKVVERVERYCKLLKHIWERQAADVIAEQRWSTINDQTDALKRKMIEDSLTDMERTGAKFEQEANKILQAFSDHRLSNDALARDCNLVLRKLKEVRETHVQTKEEFQQGMEIQNMAQIKENHEEIRLLQKQLNEWNRKVDFRERQKADPTTIKDLNKSLVQERTTQARLKCRIEQLKGAMEYTMESFKHSNKIHSDYLKEVNEKTIPLLFETTKNQAKELLNSDLLGVKPLKRQLEKQMQCLVSKRTEGIMMTAEQMRLIEENTSINANLNFLDNAIARTESDLKSCKLESENVTHTLRNANEEITELDSIKVEGTKCVNKITGLTKTLQMSIPGLDRQRLSMIRMKQEYSAQLSEIRMTLNKLSDASTSDSMWPLIRELYAKWIREPEQFPEIDTSYQRKLNQVDRLETVGARILRQCFMLSQRKTAELRKTI